MKKIILALFVIFSLVIALPSCNFGVDDSNPDFDLLNDLCNKDFSSYTIKVAIEYANGGALNEQYDVTVVEGVKNVNYKVERFSGFDTNGDSISVPGNYVTTTEGTLTSSEADEYALPEFNFSYKTLGSDMVVGRTLKANIVSLKGFAGIDMSISNGSVKVEYTSSAVNNVAITFDTDSGNTVTVTYIFN